MVVPGVATSVGVPAASDAVRHAAVAGSTPTTAAPVAAPWRAAAAASEPHPDRDEIRSWRPARPPRRRACVAVDDPAGGAGVADVGELDASG